MLTSLLTWPTRPVPRALTLSVLVLVAMFGLIAAGGWFLENINWLWTTVLGSIVTLGHRSPFWFPVAIACSMLAAMVGVGVYLAKTGEPKRPLAFSVVAVAALLVYARAYWSALDFHAGVESPSGYASVAMCLTSLPWAALGIGAYAFLTLLVSPGEE